MSSSGGRGEIKFCVSGNDKATVQVSSQKLFSVNKVKIFSLEVHIFLHTFLGSEIFPKYM